MGVGRNSEGRAPPPANPARMPTAGSIGRVNAFGGCITGSKSSPAVVGVVLSAFNLLSNTVWETYEAIVDACCNTLERTDCQTSGHNLDRNRSLGIGQNLGRLV